MRWLTKLLARLRGASSSGTMAAPASAFPSAEPADPRAEELAEFCRSSFELDRANEEQAFKEWKAGFRERAADFIRGSGSVG